MLRLDEKNILVESGALWNKGRLTSLKNNLNLFNFEDVLASEKVEIVEYNAWWYCCIPMSLVNKNNLPLPLFIRGDDIEYGLRNAEHIILINGICIWHEAFDYKYASFFHYYIVRNLLINNSIHYNDYSRFEFLIFFYKKVMRDIVYYRYKDVSLCIKAVHDFLVGVDFLINIDPELYHSELVSQGYQLKKIDECELDELDFAYFQGNNMQEDRLMRIFRFLTFNGYLLPSKKRVGVNVGKPLPVYFFKAAEVLQYDPIAQKGFYTSKCIIRTLQCISQLLSVTSKFILYYGQARNEYRKRFQELISLDFWNDYLDTDVYER